MHPSPLLAAIPVVPVVPAVPAGAAALAGALVVAIAAAMAPSSVAAATADPAQATERCEAEVSDTIRRMRGKQVSAVQFTAGARALSPTVDDEIGVRGEGRYRRGPASVGFTYSCSYNAATGATSGVVFRETGTTGETTTAWQPDLTHVSPEACESAIAAVLKDKHPRVGRIVFGSESRQLQPAENARVGLVGQGAVQPAPGMNAVPFNYRCEIDPRNGRVMQAQATD